MTKAAANRIKPKLIQTPEGKFNELRSLATEILEADNNLRQATLKIITERKRDSAPEYLSRLEEHREAVKAGYVTTVQELNKFLAANPPF